MSIALRHITLAYGRRILLRDVSASVPPGSLTALIGRNGTGKSTLLRAVAGLGAAASGGIELCGKPLAALTPLQRASTVSFVTTDKVRIANLACEDVVALGRAPYTNWIGRMQEADRAVVERSLELVGMSGFARRSFSTLSGGEQQRVILARALAQQTPCLILDEPTNHLDIKYQLELMDIVKSLDRTVISAIHDLNIAAMYCDRLYAVKGGEIVGCGRPQEVLTEDFIRRVYEVEAKVFSDESGQLHILYHPAHRL